MTEYKCPSDIELERKIERMSKEKQTKIIIDGVEYVEIDIETYHQLDCVGEMIMAATKDKRRFFAPKSKLPKKCSKCGSVLK